MSKIINLNKVRKRKARDDAEQRAAENRVRFGRTKSQKLHDEAQNEEARRRMDLLKRESGNGGEQADVHPPGAASRPIEAWAQQAMQRWPNVPALFGWLSLNRRGQWLIRGETITRPQIIDTINRNYAADERGRWYFQNGPQRGYMQLEATPLILSVDGQGRLAAHTGETFGTPLAAYLDENGALLIDTGAGAGLLDGADLAWGVERLQVDGRPADESDLARALALSSGEATGLALVIDDRALPLTRLDQALAPAALGFVRDPRPDA